MFDCPLYNMSNVRFGLPSLAGNQSCRSAEYRFNGSNQRDTGHWIWSAPPAAMAEIRPLGLASVHDCLGRMEKTGSESPISDNISHPQHS